jgi:hypothetical protein
LPLPEPVPDVLPEPVPIDPDVPPEPEPPPALPEPPAPACANASEAAKTVAAPASQMLRFIAYLLSSCARPVRDAQMRSYAERRRRSITADRDPEPVMPGVRVPADPPGDRRARARIARWALMKTRRRAGITHERVGNERREQDEMPPRGTSRVSLVRSEREPIRPRASTRGGGRGRNRRET